MKALAEKDAHSYPAAMAPWKPAALLALVAALAAILAHYLPQLPLPPAPSDLSALRPELREWRQAGRLVQVDGWQMFVRVHDVATSGESGQAEVATSGERGQVEVATSRPTLILIHGFPTSSFDYRRALSHLEGMLKGWRIVMFDHVGFGFSQKPETNFTYSLADHADNALLLWQQLNISRAHLVAHDMGDSVLTEILTRRQKGVLPKHFQEEFFQSVTFTNGGMRYDLINFRLSQSLLKHPLVGPMLSSLRNHVLPRSVTRFLGTRQLSTIWAPSYEDERRKRQDIDDILDLNEFNGGDRLMHKLIIYLDDRSRLEPRWLRSLSKLHVPTLLFWGNADAVSPMEIPVSLARDVLPPHVVTGKVLKDVGHFLMMERPEAWATQLADWVTSGHLRKSNR